MTEVRVRTRTVAPFCLQAASILSSGRVLVSILSLGVARLFLPSLVVIAPLHCLAAALRSSVFRTGGQRARGPRVTHPLPRRFHGTMIPPAGQLSSGRGPNADAGARATNSGSRRTAALTPGCIRPALVGGGFAVATEAVAQCRPAEDCRPAVLARPGQPPSSSRSADKTMILFMRTSAQFCRTSAAPSTTRGPVSAGPRA
jgi:hypothetical protein